MAIILIMTKQALANELRNRVRKTNIVPEEVLSSVPDVDIIEGYTKCCQCGEVWIAGKELERLIVESNSAEDFITLVGKQGCCSKVK
jgi:hypothetical protein